MKGRCRSHVDTNVLDLPDSVHWERRSTSSLHSLDHRLAVCNSTAGIQGLNNSLRTGLARRRRQGPRPSVDARVEDLRTGRRSVAPEAVHPVNTVSINESDLCVILNRATEACR